MRKYYKYYVCPHCFEQISKCKCEVYPQNLLHIDINLQKPIREINKKGYRTLGCCEGHFDKHDTELYIVINLDMDKDFAELPQGFKSYRQLPSSAYKIYYEYQSNEDEENFELEKQNSINRLNAWIDAMPEYDGRFKY